MIKCHCNRIPREKEHNYRWVFRYAAPIHSYYSLLKVDGNEK
jgi:hypothetical protein